MVKIMKINPHINSVLIRKVMI